MEDNLLRFHTQGASFSILFSNSEIEPLASHTGGVGSNPTNATKDDSYNSRTRSVRCTIHIERAGERRIPIFLLSRYVRFTGTADSDRAERHKAI